MGKRKDGTMGLFIGVTRSGKSTPIKAMVPKWKRLLIWDAKNEYGLPFKMNVVRSMTELCMRLRDCTGDGKFAYVPNGFTREEFNNFCRLAHAWNRQKEATIVVEELAAVTNCAKAHGYWGVLVNQSMGLGATLLATVQRGQEVDKSIMNAASILYICQHNTEDDVRYMSKKLDIKAEDIPRKPLMFLVINSIDSVVTKGEVRYRSNTPYFKVDQGQLPKIFHQTVNSSK